MAKALSAALLSIAGPGDAQSIVNTARATWVQGGVGRVATSNEVVTPVETASASVALFHPANGATVTEMSTSLCGGKPLELDPASNSKVLALPAAPADTIRVGEILLTQVTAPLANRDAGAVDELVVSIVGKSGDKEELTLFETGVNTGLFSGAIRTASIPPAPVIGDCRLSVRGGDTIQVLVNAAQTGVALASRVLNVLADPFGLVFDSTDGKPINGARVTLVDAATGLPAKVFAEDGITPWPATVVTGSTVTDGLGNVYQLATGEYRFPLLALQSYRLKVEPPAPYSAPSTATPAALATLRRPDGQPYEISAASFLGDFTLQSPDAVRVDVPLDRPSVGVMLTKTASLQRAQPGDIVTYTLTVINPDRTRAQTTTSIVDLPSPWLRLMKDTVSIDGERAPGALTPGADGGSFVVNPGTIGPGATVRITYRMTVRPDTPVGQLVNRVESSDPAGNRALSEATVTVDRDAIASRMTLIGRVTVGSCFPGENGPGIPSVRVMLEDGSFAITDQDGRYHFEGLMPGTHVAAIAPTTLPQGARPVDCNRSVESAGSAISRFVTGRGGTLAVADFVAEVPGWQPAPGPADKTAKPAGKAENGAAAAKPGATPLLLGGPKRKVTSDREAAGAETDWIAMGDGPTEFLFPTIDYNPRIPSIRVVIRHQNGQKIALRINNQPVDPLSFEGTRGGPRNAWGVSVWRGIPLTGTRNVLTATVTNKDGSIANELERVVQFVSSPWSAQIVPAKSNLVADGKTRPVVAVRFTDRQGRPVRSGVTGAFSVAEPYQSAAMIDQLQAGQLSGAGPGSSGRGASWTIENDDGIAMIELAPTMVSGPLHLEFNFADDQLTRRQQLEGWVVPGDLPFTLVGLAEGTVGARSVADQMERGAAFDSDLGENARVAFYAKGRVPGNMLLTLSYDSAKEKAAQRLTGAIDPSAYYTIYADGSTRRFDAASTEKLYVRLEAKAFYALYGDLVTGFDETQLARYQRTVTGVKAETRIGAFHAEGFAAKVATRHRHQEIQGAGISGPYAIADRNILAGSERVAIEVRDRFRSEIILSRRELVRFIDYDLDLMSATIRFKEPVLSRDFDLNPQFIVIDFEASDSFGDSQWNGGARADLTFGKNGAVRIGATAISDKGEGARTSLGALDLKAHLDARTELRAEVAATRKSGANATAFLAEVEHHTGTIDVLAYARQVDHDFGTGQQNGVELGRRKFGVDGRVALGESASIVARGWYDESLTDPSSRAALEADFVYRGLSGEGRIGIAHRTDHLADGATATATMLEAQASKRFLGNRLELGVGTSLALGSNTSIDLPTRQRLTARFLVSEGIRLVGNYEIAHGDAFDSQNFNAGVEVAPWAGGRFVGSLGNQDIAEAGTRTYAAFGLSQSLPVTSRLTIDATLDGNRKLGGADTFSLVNPLHPNSSGGQLGQGGGQYENFIAATLGAAWRAEAWSATVRGEWRDGEFATRKGVIAGLVRQLGNGVTLGGGASWTRADGDGLASTEVVQAAIAAAYRPAHSPFAALGKLEYRSDAVTDAVAGVVDATGQTALNVTGNAANRRLIASVSADWRPDGEADDRLVQRTSVGVFLGSRFNLDRIGADEVSNTALMAGLDARYGICERIELGAGGSLRTNLADGTTSFAFGPQISLSPARNTAVTLGYNVTGFRDPDFSGARYTDSGIYASIRLKFDGDSLGMLDLRR